MDLIEDFASRSGELEKEIHELVGKDDPGCKFFQFNSNPAYKF